MLMIHKYTSSVSKSAGEVIATARLNLASSYHCIIMDQIMSCDQRDLEMVFQKGKNNTWTTTFSSARWPPEMSVKKSAGLR